MKTLVTYQSQTGNTEKLARSIYDVLEGEKDILPIDEVKDTSNYDLIYTGAPIMQFGLPNGVKAFLKNMDSQQPLALFVTHAMPEDMPQLEQILQGIKEGLNSINLIGLYNCRGTLSEDLAKQLLASNKPELQTFASMQPHSVGHPNAAELEKGAVFARQIQDQWS